MTPSESPKNNSGTVGLVFIIISALLVVFGIIGAWAYFTWHWKLPNKNFEVFGSFGDSFGVVNALFSGLALAAIAITLWQAQRQIRIQQDELRLNTAELAAQREELTAQRVQMEKQNQHLAKQAIQNQFFQMLDSWQRLVHETPSNSHVKKQIYGVMNPKGDTEGRAALVDTTSWLRNIQGQHPITTDLEPSEVIGRCRKVYDEVYGVVGYALGHYFRLLYHTIRFVNSQPSTVLSFTEKADLARVLRSHLSQPELTLLFYNGLSKHGEKLYPLIEMYQLLHNMDRGDIPTAALLLYPSLTIDNNIQKIRNGHGAIPSTTYYVFPLPDEMCTGQCNPVSAASRNLRVHVDIQQLRNVGS